MASMFPASLENLIDGFASLPGIGRKSAQRLAFHILSLPEGEAERFANAVLEARSKVHTCPVCQNLTEDGLCPICASENRDRTTVCVVSEPRDVLSIENTGQYRGVYHILGGIISPIDGIGPSDLHIRELSERLKDGSVKEVILALSPTMEGDTTCFYISRKLKPFETKITEIARGIAIGDELQYADEITLGRSIVNRVEFKV